MKKEIIGLMMVGNEDDILEQSIRHNIRYLDRLTVSLDIKSVDGCREIIEGLIAEGLPIDLIMSPIHPDLDFRTNFVNRRNAWAYVFIDDDEFICGHEPDALRDFIFNRSMPMHISLPWKNFVVNPMDFDSSDIPRSFKYARKYEEPQFFKSIYIRCHSNSPHKISHGGHSVEGLQGVRIEHLIMAHYPVRSIEKLEIKYFATNLDYSFILKNKLPKGYGFHLRNGYQKLLEGNYSDLNSLFVESMEFASSRKDFTEKDIEIFDVKLEYVKTIKTKKFTAIQSIARMLDKVGKYF